MVQQGKDFLCSILFKYAYRCFELNNLNKILQEDNVDVTSLGIAIYHTLNTLKRNFCRSNSFVEGTLHLSKNFKDSTIGFLQNVDKEGTTHIHALFYIPIQDE